VSTVAHPKPASEGHNTVPWSRVSTERVVRLGGLTSDQLAISLDPLPDDAPVVIAYQVTPPCPAPIAIVDGVLIKLETLARELFPAWLPGGDAIDAASGLDRSTAENRLHFD